MYCSYTYIYIYISSTAKGGGGSFRIGNLYERLVVVNHRWQSAATDGSIHIYIYMSICLPYLVSLASS